MTVIGGGLAGLSAASHLANAGWRVLVLEARSRLGGRATAFRNRETGYTIDNGQHVLFGCYRETFAFLRRVGASDSVHLQADLEIASIDERGRETLLRCPPVPAPLHLLAGVLEWDAMALRDRLSILKILGSLRLAQRYYRGRTTHRPASPGETVHEWLVVNGQSEPLRRILWEPLALAALNQSSRVAAAEPFVRVLSEMFSGDRSDAAIGLPSAPLDLALAEPARTFVEARGGEVRTECAGHIGRRRVGPGEARPTGRPHVSVESRGEAIDTRVVICAVPWFRLRQTLDARVADQPGFAAVVANADALGSCPIVTVNLWFDRPVLARPFVGLVSRTFQWVFDKRLIWGDPEGHLSLVSSGADDVLDRTNEELVACSMREFCEAVPEARDATLMHTSVVRQPRATFSLAPDAPSRPDTRTPFENLFLAGDWIDTGLPATIEGAVVSGHRAAAAAAALLAS